MEKWPDPGAQDFLRNAVDTQRFHTSRKCSHSKILLLPCKNTKKIISILKKKKKSISDMSASFSGEGSLGSICAS